MGNKLPWFPFFPSDWTNDPQLSMCEPATRGIWIDAICLLHQLRSGDLSGTSAQLARALRCSESQLAHAITDLQTTGAADVTQRNGKVTLTCRRVARLLNERNGNKMRQQRFRGNDPCNAPRNALESESESEAKRGEEKIPPGVASQTEPEIDGNYIASEKELVRVMDELDGMPQPSDCTDMQRARRKVLIARRDVLRTKLGVVA